MDPVSLRQLYDHHAWSMDRLFARALDAPPERAAEAPRPGALSLRDTLAHIVSAEGYWRGRWQGRERYDRFRPDSVESVAWGWMLLQAEVRAFLASLEPADLERPLEPNPKPGDRGTLGAAITHVLLHGAQHSAEAAELLTQLGHSPGPLDYMEYLDELERALPLLGSL